ncbi:unnamed protein product [Euphydryas editha]|uniref:Uncharacterized protein n=1 Tax=Euphydryas editha TaxID=104508 RepID=A0AAU9VB14_EUPED|nr:unnamed protein product [Euphydryas editha]
MLLVVLSILVSISAVHSEAIYGNIEAVSATERQYVQDLIDMPKPLQLDLQIQRCSKYLSVAIDYLCPSSLRTRRTSGPRQSKLLEIDW